MKKTVSFLLSLFFAATLFTATFADGFPDRMVDGANLLTASEETELRELFDQRSAELSFDIGVVTMPAQTCFGTSRSYQITDDALDDYAVDYYNGNGFSSDGILLFVFVCDDGVIRWVQPAGRGERLFGATERGEIGETLGSTLTSWSFRRFEGYCYDRVTAAGQFAYGKTLLAALAIGLIVALIVTGVMRRKMKTVRSQDTATQYVCKGSMVVTDRRDTFLYHTVTRTARPKDTSRSGGGGGAHHGSGGRV